MQQCNQGVKGVDRLKIEVDADINGLAADDKLMQRISEKSIQTAAAVKARAEAFKDSLNYRKYIDWEALSKIDNPITSKMCEINERLDKGYSERYNKIGNRTLDKLVIQAAKSEVIRNALAIKNKTNLTIIQRAAIHCSITRARERAHER